MCPRAGSSTVWMDEAIPLDVLGSSSADLSFARERGTTDVHGQETGREGGETIAGTHLAHLFLTRTPTHASIVFLKVSPFLLPAISSSAKEVFHDEGHHEKER